MKRAVVRAALLGMLPVVLALSLWRAERDRPLWLGPGLAATLPAPAVSLPSSPRLVLAVQYPWYGTPGGPTGRWRHWNHPRLGMPEERILGFHDPRREVAPRRLDIGATHYPQGGPYDSRDPADRWPHVPYREPGQDEFGYPDRQRHGGLGIEAACLVPPSGRTH